MSSLKYSSCEFPTVDSSLGAKRDQFLLLYPALQVDELLAMVAHLPLVSRARNGPSPSRPSLLCGDVSVPRLAGPRTFLSPFEFITKEQRARCDRVELVHFLTHAGDDALCLALDSGAYRWADVTSVDVRLNRKWRGPCIACLQGKFHAKSMPASTTQPAQAVGELISVDTQQLEVKSHGGNLCYINSIDEFSSDWQVTPAKSLKSVDLFAAIMSLVHTRYNAYGHKVVHIMSDPLPAMESLVAMLGAFGILLTFTPPGQHAQRVERAIQGLAGRRRAVLASLPFFIPKKYTLYAHHLICETSNCLPTKHNHPSCADILVTGRRRADHYAHPDIGFGVTCLVGMFENKRRAEASLVDSSLSDVTQSEIGVCMGYSRSSPMSYDFLLTNGQIVPRAVIKRVNYRPFGWPVRTVLLPSLDPPSVGPVIGAPMLTPMHQSPIQPSDPGSLADVHAAGSSDEVVPVAPWYPPSPSFVLPVPVAPPASIIPVVPVVTVLPEVPLESVSPELVDSSLDAPASGFPSSALEVPCRRSSHVIPSPVRVTIPPTRVSTRTRTPRVITSMMAAPYPVAVHPYAYLMATCDCKGVDEYTQSEALSLLSSSSSVSLVAPLPSSMCIPIPSMRGKEESLSRALRTRGVERLAAPTLVEIDKQQRLKAISKESYILSQLPHDALVVEAHCLYKVKADGRDTCRIAVMGNHLPPKSAEETFASVVSDGPKFVSMALMQAHCEIRQEALYIIDADVVGGFLNIPLNSPVPMFLHLPRNLPHPLAGKYLRIFHAVYGLQESNRLFSLEMTRVIVSDAKFRASRAEPQQFLRCDPVDPGIKCIGNVTVDDVLIVTNSLSLAEALLDALTTRFGPLTVHRDSQMHTGIEMVRRPDGGLLLTQDGAIARAASVVGVSHLPPIDVPTDADFFLASFPVLECSPVDSTVYSALTGRLVQFLKTRHEVRLFVSYLCSFNHAPLEGHFRRALHVLRYLASTPGIGPVFKSSVIDLSVFTDAAFGVCRYSGRSSTGNMFSVGRDNAPFFVTAKAQSDVATCPMTAEYYAASTACKNVVYFREVYHDLGWPITSPVSVYIDNKTCIKLVEAMQVPVKSRHIEFMYHYIRKMQSDGRIKVVHVYAAQMRADILTKVLPRASFLRARACLFNTGGCV